MTDQTADRAAAPVKQRADCTETEWAEQERARFERLYTRETVRADTAARDAEIYQGRLKRLGEGYTKQRQRAEQAEAEAERLRTDRAATCICEHTEAQHFEDACLACDCGDYLVPEAAREVIARWRAAATRAPTDRATVLDEAASRYERLLADMGADTAKDPRYWLGVHHVTTGLRHLADEARPDCDGCGHAPHPVDQCQGFTFNERCECDEPVAAAPAVSSVGQTAHTTRSAEWRAAADHLDGLHLSGVEGGIRTALTDELRRMADETQPAEAEALACVCGSPAIRDGDRWTHQPNTGDGCLYRPDARPRCPECQMPHVITPSMQLVCASILASIRDRDAAGPAAGAQQPKEARS